MAVDSFSTAISEIKGQPYGKKTYGSAVSVPTRLAARQKLGSFFIHLCNHFRLKWRVFLCPWQENVSRKDRKISFLPSSTLAHWTHHKVSRKKKLGEIPFRMTRLVSFYHLCFQLTVPLNPSCVAKGSGVTLPRVLLPQPRRELPSS